MREDEQDNSRNIARFFTRNRQIAWVALVATLAWGVFGYVKMPKRKDPDIPVRVGLAITPWPGIAAEKVEQLVTRKIEQAATGNASVERVESTTQDNVSVALIRLLDKNLVRRDRAGRGHAYRPAEDAATAAAGQMRAALAGRPDRLAVLQQFAASLDAADAEALRRLLAEQEHPA